MPPGTVTTNRVDTGRLVVGTNASVRSSTQVAWPGMFGARTRGGEAAGRDTWSRATIGFENARTTRTGPAF